MTSTAGQFRILALESIRDAFRRKLVATVIVATLLSMWVLDGCTSCVPTSDVQFNSDVVDLADWVGAAGMVLFGLIATWTMVLAGLLASGHLSDPVEDGSAALLLSKPVSRVAFALGRLAGLLVVVLATSAAVLTAATFFIAVRHDLPVAPGIAATLTALVGCIVIAALAMLLSLYFNRTATFLFVFFVVGCVVTANLMMLLGQHPSGFMWGVNNFGPPLATTIGIALAPWGGREIELAVAVQVYARLLVWVVLSCAGLAWYFRKMEIPA